MKDEKNEKKLGHIFTRLFGTLYWPWIIDIIIAIFSVFLIFFFIYQLFSDVEVFTLWDSILSVFSFVYSTNNAIVKIIDNRKEKDNFRRALDPVIESCKKIITTHIPNSASTIEIIEKKVLDIHFDEWKKFKNVSSFKYEIINTVVTNISTFFELCDGDKLFIKYVLITSAFPLFFPNLVTEIKNASFYQEGSPYNNFVRKLHEFTKTNNPLNELTLVDIDDATIEETINCAFNTSYSKIKVLVKEKENRRKVDYLLNKCFENAYTNAGNLQCIISDDSSKKFFLLYKYDERFSIQKRKWNSAIKDYYNNNIGDKNRAEIKINEAKARLEKIILPYPFSKALMDFSYYIEKLAPKDHFSFIVYPEKFINSEQGFSVNQFIEYRVLPVAQNYLDDLNKNLIQEFPFLVNLQKKSLDANYYLFEFTREQFAFNASPGAMPETIKRFLIKNILDSDEAGSVVASQLVYIKQVINHLSISGLLFTESKESQEKIRSIENRLIQILDKQGIHIRNIYEIMSIGNQYDSFEATIFKLLNKSELKRRYGKKYNETKYLAQKIISNAKDIVSIFNSINSSQNHSDPSEE